MAFATTAAIVGLGQLGNLLAAKLAVDRLLLVSSDREKAESVASRIPGAEYAAPERLREAGLVVYCLPAHELTGYVRQTAAHLDPRSFLVNPATMLDTHKLRKEFEHARWIPLKFLGSVKALETGVPALMVTDDTTAREVLLPFVSPLGELIVGDEKWVSDCNTIAAHHALEAVLRMEEDIRRRGYPESLIYPAQTVVAKGIMQSYADGTLGHFAKDVLERVKTARTAAKPPAGDG